MISTYKIGFYTTSLVSMKVEAEEGLPKDKIVKLITPELIQDGKIYDNNREDDYHRSLDTDDLIIFENQTEVT